LRATRTSKEAGPPNGLAYFIFMITGIDTIIKPFILPDKMLKERHPTWIHLN
jgi:hypothetical protein